MDRVHLEPRHRLHEDQSGLQALLRGTHGSEYPTTSASDGASELGGWIEQILCPWLAESREHGIVPWLTFAAN